MFNRRKSDKEIGQESVERMYALVIGSGYGRFVGIQKATDITPELVLFTSLSGAMCSLRTNSVITTQMVMDKIWEKEFRMADEEIRILLADSLQRDIQTLRSIVAAEMEKFRAS